MSKFRKKPVVIEAVSWDGGKDIANIQFLNTHGEYQRDWQYASREAHEYGGPILILTLEGQMRCEVGDWIICGVKGELYPCKADIFAATYEPVDDG